MGDAEQREEDVKAAPEVEVAKPPPPPPPKPAPFVVGTAKVRAPSLNTLDTHYAMANETQWNISWSTWSELIKSGTLPRHVKSPEAAMALAEAGRVHGWTPLIAVRLLCLIEGQVSMTVNGMWTLVTERVVSEAGCKVKLIENSLERAAYEVVRPAFSGDDPVVYEFTRQDAEEAKLWGRVNPSGKDSPWVLYKRDMLLARAKARVSRNAFSDVVFGAYTDEELVHSDFHKATDGIVEAILAKKDGPRTTTLDDITATRGPAQAVAGA